MTTSFPVNPASCLLYLEEINSEGMEQKVGMVQECLANVDWIRARRTYLNLLVSMGIADGFDSDGIVGPLTKKELEDIVKFGLVFSWKKGNISTKSIGELLHSLSGLTDLSRALFSMPTEEWANCWQRAMDCPWEIPDPDMEKIYRDASSSE